MLRFSVPDLETLLGAPYNPILPVLNKPHPCKVPDAVVPMAPLKPVHTPMQAAWWNSFLCCSSDTSRTFFGIA